MIWLSYDMAWGGQFDGYYKPQKVGNYPISENELQPIKFQGQFYDVETSLHYNRFGYFDSDAGMFISRDPIGLLGGNNVFQYAPNPTGWVDPLGLQMLVWKDVVNNWPQNGGKQNLFTDQYGPNNGEIASNSIFHAIYGNNYDSQIQALKDGNKIIPMSNACASRGSLMLNRQNNAKINSILSRNRNFTGQAYKMKGKPIVSTAKKFATVMDQIYSDNKSR